MEPKLQSFSGYRAPRAESEDTSLLMDIFPYLPEAVDEAIPLYVTIGLLFVVISRAARRKLKGSPHLPPTHEELVRRSNAQSMGSNPRLGAHSGYWGDAGPVSGRD